MIKATAKYFLKGLVKSSRVRNYLENECAVGSQLASENPQKAVGLYPITIKDRECQLYPFGSIPKWRYDTFFTKEPETLEWIESWDTDGEHVFWDIGANVGLYSLYAAIVQPRASVFAFEPQASNYYVMNKNIEINDFSDRVSAYCVAFSDACSAAQMSLLETSPGGSLAQFGAPVKEIHAGKYSAPVTASQSMIGFSIDSFIDIFKPAFPTHIKIDVDGIEASIVEGAGTTFADKRCRSVQIEMDETMTSYVAGVTSRMEGARFKLRWKRHSDLFGDGDFSSIYNYVFDRV